MNNMLTTIIPKSDQLNADDLIGGQTKTVKITKVSLLGGDQPVALNYEGDNGKPYKPGKSMRRVLVHVWGGDGNKYIGRSLTLFRDDKVMFGGVATGGLRISHMSDISESVTMALTATRANRKPFTVKPLALAQEPSLQDWMDDIKSAPTLEVLGFKFKEAQKLFRNEEQRAQLTDAKDARKSELSPAEALPSGDKK
jgi:hypothetical protein